MDREASINSVEKNRLRASIQDQVQRFLERGGRITVVEGPAGAPSKAVQGGDWDTETDLDIGLEG